MSNIYNDLKNSGQAFVYVFIDPKANLNNEIMTKRVQQLARLNEMYQADKTYTPAQMINIIREGIQAKYNRTPEQILSILYYNYGTKVNGIGTITGSHFDGKNWVSDTTGEVLAESDAVLATKDASGKTTSTFWTDVASVVTWIVGIFQTLGITKPASTVSAYIPGQTDWKNLNTGSSLSSAGIGDYLPYVAGAAILYYLVTMPGKKGSKQK